MSVTPLRLTVRMVDKDGDFIEPRMTESGVEFIISDPKTVRIDRIVLARLPDRLHMFL